MACFPPEFYARAAAALKVLTNDPLVEAAIEREIAEFFVRNPNLHRTRMTETFIGALVIERFSMATPVVSTPTQQPKIA